jgi:thiol-disulfide isomerase/thioredoxin
MQMTQIGRHTILAIAGAAALSVGPAQAQPPALNGRWDATVVVNGVEIPFLFEIDTRNGAPSAAFFNGERRIRSTSSQVKENGFQFSFAQYAAALDFSVNADQLAGEYRRGTRTVYPFKATRASAAARSGASGPSIEGTWIVQAKSSKGEIAWRFIARQDGNNVSASILRVDGDTGTLTGSYRDGRYVLSHFSGARPLLLEVFPGPDGSITLRQNAKTELKGIRESDARASEIGAPTDPSRHTTVANPAEPFRFSFPDLSGRIVSNTDPRFAGKVVLVNISGSWCPNCHDEAPFLAALYEKYRSRGLEIVTLSFEEPEQLANPTRLRAFIDTYGLKYTVLLAGETEQLNEKVPQAVNLNAFPTTFFLGRDGRVRGVHAGFPSPGSGEFYRKAEREMTAEVERLLAERQTTRR